MKIGPIPPRGFALGYFFTKLDSSPFFSKLSGQVERRSNARAECSGRDTGLFGACRDPEQNASDERFGGAQTSLAVRNGKGLRTSSYSSQAHAEAILSPTIFEQRW